jgi:PhoPQ-activated pathogenicity-related protein
VLFPCFACAAEPVAPSDLVDYVTRKDPSFSWKLVDTKKSDAGTIYEIDLVSQTWHDIKWDHKLQVFVHKDAKPQATMVLWNQGGTPNLLSGAMGLAIAERVKAPVAFLYGVPKQPLYRDAKSGKLTTVAPNPDRPREGALVEDALIAETYVRYLDSKDSSWPLLFAMVKSVVSAMDALQQFARKEWDFEVKSFVVTGASKRGWTSWLVAATGDKRVKAIAPIVFDTLNMPVQMKNQVNAFGKPSEMIKDYTERKLIPIPDTPEAKKLWLMIDPWVYREKLTMPKLIINGTNDPYWPLDALNSYWDDLKGDKWILYVPNAGHDLRERDKDGKPELLPMRAINTLSAFARCMIFDKPMPKLSWRYLERNPDLTVLINSPGAKSRRVWTARAETRDFRKAYWQSEIARDDIGGWGFLPPDKGYRAVFVESEFEVDGLKFNLSTQLRVLEPKK